MALLSGVRSSCEKELMSFFLAKRYLGLVLVLFFELMHFSLPCRILHNQGVLCCLHQKLTSQINGVFVVENHLEGVVLAVVVGSQLILLVFLQDLPQCQDLFLLPDQV
jgi:hypothetical protein